MGRNTLSGLSGRDYIAATDEEKIPLRRNTLSGLSGRDADRTIFRHLLGLSPISRNTLSGLSGRDKAILVSLSRSKQDIVQKSQYPERSFRSRRVEMILLCRLP